MNDEPNIPRANRDGCGIDVAAYALGALEPAEAEAFATHLQTCAVCREELIEFQSVVSALPMSVPAHAAPPRLRRRVLAAVAADAQPSSAPGRPTRRRLRWPALPRPALALGTALAVVVIAIAGVLELGSGSARQTRVYNAQVMGSSASARLKVTDGRAELVVRRMPPPPRGEIYQVWVARSNGVPQPTSVLFSVTRTGNGDVAVPGSLRGVRVVMVTPEPAGGSRAPTHPPVIRAQLT